MQQTTHDKNRNQTGPLSDAGPYDYDLPVVSGVGPPAPAPRPTWKSGLSLKGFLAIGFVTVGAQVLRDWSGWSQLQCYTLLYCVAVIFMYWDTPKPRQGFLSWSLKVVGIFLNCYVGLVTVPESLRGLLPEPLAFGLPAFLIMAFLYCALPVRPDTGKKAPLWQWLLCATAFAVIWGWVGPSFVK